MRMHWLAVAALAAVVALGACSKKEEPAPEAAKPQGLEMPPSHPPAGGQPAPGMPPAPPTPRQVVVPEEVQNTWKGVVLELTNKSDNTSEDVSVDIGETVTVGELEITVESFLPAFSMGGGMITSNSNETENPAAQLIVRDAGNEVFSGWLFSLYPEAHPFQHEKYNVLLKDFIKK